MLKKKKKKKKGAMVYVEELGKMVKPDIYINAGEADSSTFKDNKEIINAKIICNTSSTPNTPNAFTSIPKWLCT